MGAERCHFEESVTLLEHSVYSPTAQICIQILEVLRVVPCECATELEMLLFEGPTSARQARSQGANAHRIVVKFTLYYMRRLTLIESPTWTSLFVVDQFSRSRSSTCRLFSFCIYKE